MSSGESCTHMYSERATQFLTKQCAKSIGRVLGSDQKQVNAAQSFTHVRSEFCHLMCGARVGL
jgi:hypothetical protein